MDASTPTRSNSMERFDNLSTLTVSPYPCMVVDQSDTKLAPWSVPLQISRGPTSGLRQDNAQENQCWTHGKHVQRERQRVSLGHTCLMPLALSFLSYTCKILRRRIKLISRDYTESITRHTAFVYVNTNSLCCLRTACDCAKHACQICCPFSHMSVLR